MPRNYDAFFHLAGSSEQKGTAPLVDVWRAHPEWPTLTIVQHPNNRLDVQGPNITYISEHIDDEKLRHLQNEMGIHVCPSEAERLRSQHRRGDELSRSRDHHRCPADERNRVGGLRGRS